MAIIRVEIDAELLRLAMGFFGASTNQDAINLALREAVMRRRQVEAIDDIAHGNVALDEVPPTTPGRT